VIETILRENPIYSFSKNSKPVKSIKPGTQIIMETYDALENQIKSDVTLVNHLDWNRVNPATGPVYVEGAKPGDILKVTIDKLEIENQGVMLTGKGLGVMGHRLKAFDVKIVPIKDGKAIFDEKLAIPLNPMIGVIGVAPAGEPVSCGTPGSHGGNMDTKLVTEGATMFFPVFVEGALLAIGDIHAAMGDGEISVTGVEVSGRVTITVDIIKENYLPNPLLENQKGIALIVSAKTLDEAVKTSVEQMIDILHPYTDLTLSHIIMLMSLIGQVQISQVVDPLVTVRFFVSKCFLEAYNIHLFE